MRAVLPLKAINPCFALRAEVSYAKTTRWLMTRLERTFCQMEVVRM